MILPIRYLGKRICAAGVFYLLSYVAAGAQPESPALELEGYRIIGKDTRVFTITGDRFSTVDFVRSPIIIPREEHDIEASKGLIGEDERIHREEDFTVQRGFYSSLDAESGSNTPLVLWGKASMDRGSKAGAIRLINRMAKVNTPTNSAPYSLDAEAVGYYDASFAQFAVDGMYGRENDEINGEFFRNCARSVRRYGAGVTMNLPLFKAWDVSGRFSLDGANYKDREQKPQYDDNEFRIAGSGNAAGTIGSTTIVVDAVARYLRMFDRHGTITTVNGVGEWLIFGSLGLKTGASVTAFGAPGNDETEFRLRPRIIIDWVLTPRLFLNVAYKPGVISHSFSELYDLNGLVLYTVPMLFEDRIIDVDGEFGLKLSQNLKGSLGAFYIKSKDMPLYSRSYPSSPDSSVEFYRIVADSEIKLAGTRLRFTYEKQERFVVDGSLTVNSTSWNYSEKAPYIPTFEAAVNGALTFYRLWRVQGSVRYFGKHYVEKDSSEREDGFFTIDVGVDRELWDEHLRLFVDLRNLTNSQGAWWTSRYEIPGAGLYAGLKLDY